MNIFLTIVFGGPDAAAGAQGTLQPLKGSLKQILSPVKPRDFDKLDFRVYVAGSISQYKEPSGFNSSMVYTDKRSARLHVTIQQEIWKKGPDSTRRLMLASIVDGALDVERKAAAKGLVLGAPEILKALRDAFGDVVPHRSIAFEESADKENRPAAKLHGSLSKKSTNKPGKR